jgi:hypothetical protein
LERHPKRLYLCLCEKSAKYRHWKKRKAKRCTQCEWSIDKERERRRERSERERQTQQLSPPLRCLTLE